MVSASKLRRAQEAAEAARPYASRMTEMFAGLALDPEEVSHPLLVSRAAKRAAVVVVTPDRGLCGGLNTNVNKLGWQTVQKLEGEGLSVEVVAVGRKSRDYFTRRGVEVSRSWTGLLASVDYSDVQEVGNHLVDQFMEEKFDRVELVYASFKSVISQIASVQTLLPISVEQAETEAPAAPFLFEPSEEDVLGSLLPKYLEVRLFQALLESAASEHGARMSAMDAATRNAGEVIDKLTLIYNRTRQESVTSELLDIIGGVEALNA